jgi:membrane protease YdiL (CAAX protease family)
LSNNRRLLCWIIILVSVVCIIAGHAFLNRVAMELDDRSALVIRTLQGKVLVGAEQIQTGSFRRELPKQDATVATPGLARAQALLYGLMTGDDLEYGRDRARTMLGLFAGDPDYPRQEHLHHLTAMAIEDPAGLTPGEQQELLDDQGWIAAMALSRDLPKEDPARKAPRKDALLVLGLMFGLLTLAGGGTLVGCLLLVLALISRAKGGLPARMGEPRHEGTLYIEAFAVYIGLFFLLGILPGVLGIESALVSLGGLVLLSVVGLLWPVLRGMPWQDAFHDLGLYRGAGFLKEIGSGLAGYVAILPVVAAGFGLTLVWLTVSQWIAPPIPGESQDVISHPIVVWIADGGTGVRLMVLFLASGFAPFFEEALFRGALFRDLRRKFGPALSAAIMAVLFAAIHPQGIAMIPALSGLAIGFALIREWRGSLIAPMTAHAVHNGVLVCTMWIALG